MSTQTIHYESAIHSMAEASSEAMFHSVMGGAMMPRGLDFTLVSILLADTFGKSAEDVREDLWSMEKKLYADHFDRAAEENGFGSGDDGG